MWQSAPVRVFTIIGLIMLVIGIALGVVACMPSAGGIDDMAANLGAGIAALTLVPMGITFTAIGMWYQRVVGGRRRLLETGIPGEAQILDVSGGNLVINNVNHLLTMRLRVMLPGRAPYEVSHREMVPIFQMANVAIGAVVPVRVDPKDPGKVALMLGMPTPRSVGTWMDPGVTTGVVSSAAATSAVTRSAAATSAVTASAVSPAPTPAPVPNTLTSLAGVTPNTIAPDPPSDAPPLGHGHGDITAAMIGGALADQLAKWGVPLDPATLANAQVRVDQTSIDASEGAQAALLATGRPGRAFVRAATDTGVSVLGDAVMQLTLDVTPNGGATYEVRTASLVPAAARARAMPGATVIVRIDPMRPTNVAVDWLPD